MQKQPFLIKSKKIWLKSFGNNWKSFSRIFLKKRQTFWKIYRFLGESFLPPERRRKKYFKKVPTDQPTLGSSARKTGFLFFVAK